MCGPLDIDTTNTICHMCVVLSFDAHVVGVVGHLFRLLGANVVGTLRHMFSISALLHMFRSSVQIYQWCCYR